MNLPEEAELQALEINPKGTILGASNDREETLFSFEQLPQAVLETRSDRVADVELGATLGEGGMGTVFEASQVALRRSVAVKRLREDRQSPSTMRALMREAWVLGALEHPNVVPVYTLMAHADGSPMFAMKRISGVSWDVLMHDPHHPLREGSQKDPLAWNLEILMQVCNAVHFAHSKGILHRDLKPQNVMIGSFGEVYLLDWGIAISLEESPRLPLPTRSESRALAGTPGYMAPEMVMRLPEQLSERTDVYQLGAILHEILTGEPRHSGASIRDILFQTATSEAYAYPAEVPGELAAIANRATALHPRERFAHAEELRRALSHYLEHRASFALFADADLQLERLLEQISAGEGDHQEIYGLFYACKFGYRHALQVWPENQGAHRGLHRLYEAMAWYEIEHEDAKAAALHCSQLERSTPGLAEALDQLHLAKARSEAELSRLKELERNADLSTSTRQRILFCALVAAFEFPFLMGYGHLLQWVQFRYLRFFLFGAGILGGTLAFAAFFRGAILRSEINQRITLSFVVFGVLLSAFPLFTWHVGLSAKEGFGQSYALSILYLGMMGVLVERSLLWAGLLYSVAAALTFAWPLWTFEIAAVASSGGLALVAFTWRGGTSSVALS